MLSYSVRRSVILPTVLLTYALVATKILCLWPIEGYSNIFAFTAEDVAVALLFGLAITWIIVGAFLRAGINPDSWHGRALKNPHREIVASLISQLFLDRHIELEEKFPPAYLADFKFAAECQCPALAEFKSPPR